MSGFDKEAERERLREKYEKDQEKREATQRMSELLLQGATMTNRHCDECGDPIFRYEGQEFCPTCQTTKGDGSEEAAETTQDAEATREADVQANGQTADAERANQPTAEPASGEPAADADPAQSRTAEPAPEPTQPPAPTRTRTATERGEASVGRARDSLVRTLTRFAEEAEATDDPRRATELLGAAREAAETLDALER